MSRHDIVLPIHLQEKHFIFETLTVATSDILNLFVNAEQRNKQKIHYYNAKKTSNTAFLSAKVSLLQTVLC